MNNPFTELSETLAEINRKLEHLGTSKTQPDFITIDQASELLNLSKSTIYKKTMVGSLPFYKTGKKLLFRSSELTDFMANHKVKTAPQVGVMIEA